MIERTVDDWNYLFRYIEDVSNEALSGSKSVDNAIHEIRSSAVAGIYWEREAPMIGDELLQQIIDLCIQLQQGDELADPQVIFANIRDLAHSGVLELLAIMRQKAQNKHNTSIVEVEKQEGVKL